MTTTTEPNTLPFAHAHGVRSKRRLILVQLFPIKFERLQFEHFQFEYFHFPICCWYSIARSPMRVACLDSSPGPSILVTRPYAAGRVRTKKIDLRTRFIHSWEMAWQGKSSTGSASVVELYRKDLHLIDVSLATRAGSCYEHVQWAIRLRLTSCKWHIGTRPGPVPTCAWLFLSMARNTVYPARCAMLRSIIAAAETRIGNV